tara:strand:- start:121 stop:573 length:453 start_codon:yes stop_codon:yes gene_type:complete
MKFNNRFLVAITAGLLISNIILVGFVINKSNNHPVRKEPKTLIINRLKLNSHQIDFYENLIKNHRNAINSTRNKIQNNKKLLYKGLNNNEKINDSIFSIIKDLNNKIELINYNHFIDIRNICDDSQLKLFNEVSKDLHRIFSKKPPRSRK